jgi:hypothetical protein
MQASSSSINGPTKKSAVNMGSPWNVASPWAEIPTKQRPAIEMGGMNGGIVTIPDVDDPTTESPVKATVLVVAPFAEMPAEHKPTGATTPTGVAIPYVLAPAAATPESIAVLVADPDASPPAKLIPDAETTPAAVAIPLVEAPATHTPEVAAIFAASPCARAPA